MMRPVVLSLSELLFNARCRRPFRPPLPEELSAFPGDMEDGLTLRVLVGRSGEMTGASGILAGEVAITCGGVDTELPALKLEIPL